MNEMQLRQFADQSPFAIAMFNKEMHYLFANKRWLTKYKLKNEEILGKSHYQFFPELPEHWKEVHRSCLAGNTEKNDDEAFYRRDGSVDWVRWEAFPWFEKTESIGGIIIFSEDISYQKKIEESLRNAHRKLLEQQDRTEMILNQIGAAIWAIDLNGIFTFFEGGLLKELQINSDNRIGKSIFELMEDEPSFIQAIYLGLKGKAVKFETFRYSKWLEVNFTPTFDSSGKVKGLVGTSVDITDRKNAQDELKKINNELELRVQERTSELQLQTKALKASNELYKESELNLSLALESGKMGTWWMDVKGIHTELSPSLAALYGTTKAVWDTTELVNKHIHPDDRIELNKLLTQALNCSRPLYHEFRIIRADGKIRWHYLRCAFSFDKTGSAIRLYGIQGDRTRGKLVGEKLRESEEKYRKLVADAQDGILILDEENQIIYGNKQIEVMFGYPLKEILNNGFNFLIPLAGSSALNTSIGKIGNELNGRRKNGNDFPVDVKLSPSLTSNGKTVTAIIRDITLRKKKEDHEKFLATTGRVLAENFDNKNDALKKVADLAVAEFADGCALRLLGENQKLHLVAAVHRDPKKQKILEELSFSMEARNELLSDFKEVIISKNVQIIDNYNNILISSLQLSTSEKSKVLELGEFDVAIIPLKGHDKIIGVISLMFDKSNRRFEESDIGFLESFGTQTALSVDNIRLYSKSQRATKSREEILAIVSHDLRSPLTMIQMTSQLLPRVIDNKEKILNFSEKILRSTDQMKRIIEDLMDFSKIQEGLLSIEKKVEDPRLVLEVVLDVMKLQADEKDVKLKMELSPVLPVVMFDRQRLIQALLNLVGNAIKFTKPGGCVQISAVESLGAVKFSVSDTGSGISEENLTKIFDRYWQEKRSNSQSIGLGLSITKGIIEAHESSIRVDSQLGKGSNFYFTLPVKAD